MRSLKILFPIIFFTFSFAQAEQPTSPAYSACIVSKSEEAKSALIEFCKQVNAKLYASEKTLAPFKEECSNYSTMVKFASEFNPEVVSYSDKVKSFVTYFKSLQSFPKDQCAKLLPSTGAVARAAGAAPAAKVPGTGGAAGGGQPQSGPAQLQELSKQLEARAAAEKTAAEKAAKLNAAAKEKLPDAKGGAGIEAVEPGKQNVAIERGEAPADAIAQAAAAGGNATIAIGDGIKSGLNLATNGARLGEAASGKCSLSALQGENNCVAALGVLPAKSPPTLADEAGAKALAAIPTPLQTTDEAWRLRCESNPTQCKGETFAQTDAQGKPFVRHVADNGSVQILAPADIIDQQMLGCQAAGASTCVDRTFTPLIVDPLTGNFTANPISFGFNSHGEPITMNLKLSEQGRLDLTSVLEAPAFKALPTSRAAAEQRTTVHEPDLGQFNSEISNLNPNGAGGQLARSVPVPQQPAIAARAGADSGLPEGAFNEANAPEPERTPVQLRNVEPTIGVQSAANKDALAVSAVDVSATLPNLDLSTNAVGAAQQSLDTMRQEENSNMKAYDALGGDVNTGAIQLLRSTSEKLFEAGKILQMPNASEAIRNAALAYKSNAESCAKYEDMASMACIEDRNPTMKTVIETARLLGPAIQTATGMNDACNKIAQTTGKLNKLVLVATTICSGFQLMCNFSCLSTRAKLEAIKGAVTQAQVMINAAGAKMFQACVATPSSTGLPPNCELQKANWNNANAAATAAVGDFGKAWASETNKANPQSVIAKISKCGSFSDTLRKTIQSTLSLYVSNKQAGQCEQQTAAKSTGPISCDNPANQNDMTCLCKQPQFQSAPTCIAMANEGCPTGQLRNSQTLCVPIADACKDPINAMKPQCSSTIIAHCAQPQYASQPECANMISPGAATNGAVVANIQPVTPNANLNKGTNTMVTSPSGGGSGMQKMTDGSSDSAINNLNGSQGINAKLSSGAGIDGTENNSGLSSSGLAAGSDGGLSAGGSGGGLGGSGSRGSSIDRDPASDGRNGGRKGGGYIGATGESVGRGGGGGNFGGWDLDRENAKKDAQKKLAENQERAKLLGLTVLKDNGITSPSGKSLWEKVNTRYRESKSSLLDE